MKYVSMFISTFLFISLVQAADPKVTAFVTLWPAGSFQVTSSKLKGDVVKKNGQFSADKISVTVESLKSGIDLRDEHMWKHLNPTQNNPRITLSEIKSVSANKGKGTLEINGVKAPINFDYVTKGDVVEAEFEIKTSQFKLAKAEYKGVGVKEDIKVKVTMPFGNQK